MKKNRIIGSIMMLSAALIWGLAFVAQSEGAKDLPPMWFVCLRFLLGALVLVPVIVVMDRKKKKDGTFVPMKTKKDKKFFWVSSALCGLSLCAASYCQQLGLTMGTESGKAGFITALYIIMVPILGMFLGKKTRLLVWGCVAISAVGLYLLCVSENSGFRASDLVVLVCALLYSVQILIVEKASPRVDGVKLSAAQFIICSAFAFCYAIFFETITFQNIIDGLIPFLYAGIFSSGVAFTFQVVAQQKINNPTISSLLMSFESVFATLFGALILKEIPTVKEGIGCVIMFCAVILAQLPEKSKKDKTVS